MPARTLGTHQSPFCRQIGHALRDAGVESYKYAKEFRDDGPPLSLPNFVKVDQVLSSHNVENDSMASIVSEDEGDTSDAEDQTSTGNEEIRQTFPQHDINDVWTPLEVDMREKFHPRISLKSLDLLGVFLRHSIGAFDIASERIEEAKYDDNRSIAGRKHGRSFGSNRYSHSRRESFRRSDVRLSDVFESFLVDEGDSTDDEVSIINPLEWTNFDADDVFLSTELPAAS